MTPKQEQFANFIIAGVNPSEAYRKAYHCENMKDASVSTEAKKLLQNPNIAPFIEKARKEATENAKWTYKTACERLYCINTCAYSEIQKTGLKTAHNALHAFFDSLDRLNKLLDVSNAEKIEKDELDELSKSFFEEAQKLNREREIAMKGVSSETK